MNLFIHLLMFYHCGVVLVLMEVGVVRQRYGIQTYDVATVLHDAWRIHAWSHFSLVLASYHTQYACAKLGYRVIDGSLAITKHAYIEWIANSGQGIDRRPLELICFYELSPSAPHLYFFYF